MLDPEATQAAGNAESSISAILMFLKNLQSLRKSEKGGHDGKVHLYLGFLKI